MPTAWFGALLLSLALHLSLIVAAGDGGRTSATPAVSSPTIPIPVSLRLVTAPDMPMPVIESMPADNRINTGSVTAAEPKPEPGTLRVSEAVQTPGPATASNLATLIEPKPVEESPALSLLDLAAAHYFGTDGLTEKPRLFADTAPNEIISVPDIFPQPVVVHLLINERGSIDKVVLEESFLSEPAKRFVIDSFLKARFSPGKIGDLLVKSRLSIVVRLEGVLSAH